jgi:hypothetical protein
VRTGDGAVEPPRAYKTNKRPFAGPPGFLFKDQSQHEKKKIRQFQVPSESCGTQASRRKKKKKKNSRANDRLRVRRRDNTRYQQTSTPTAPPSSTTRATIVCTMQAWIAVFICCTPSSRFGSLCHQSRVRDDDDHHFSQRRDNDSDQPGCDAAAVRLGVIIEGEFQRCVCFSAWLDLLERAQ